MTYTYPKPSVKPERPYFSSGPCAKPKSWNVHILENMLLGRSHRSVEGIERIKLCLELMREVLQIPPFYEIALISGSATGAIESLLWNLLGPRPVDIYTYDVFSKKWADDIIEQLKIPSPQVYTALADLEHPNLSHDNVLAWNGSTSGICLPFSLWQGKSRQGLVVCDATSAAFAVPLPWEALDATSFSWQKGLGGEASQGVIVLSPAAFERLNNYRPTWPIPSFLRLTHNNRINTGLFQEGLTLNTLSLMALEDAIFALKWAKDLGGIRGLAKKTQQNYQCIRQWVDSTPWIDFLVPEEQFRSFTTVCLKFQKSVEWAWVGEFCKKIALENVAYDIKNHAQAYAPSLRLWAGPTVEKQDLEKLFPWLEWAYHTL